MGGAIIVWEDRRSGDDIYAQRLDHNGLWYWADDGVPVVDFASEQSHAMVAPDGNYGAIVMWKDQRDKGAGGGVPSVDGAGRRFTEPDIYMQRINGLGVQLWAADGVPVTTLNNIQSPGNVVSDGVGGAIVSWTDDSDDDLNEDVRMQHYDSSGAAQWAAGGVVHATGPGSRSLFALIDAGDDTIPVWTTYLAGPGPVAAAREAARRAGTSIFVQKVDKEDGECACGTSTSAPPAQGGVSLFMSAPAPNPTHGHAEMRVHVARASDLEVNVYNVRGRKIYTDNLGRSGKGWRTLRFDGRDLPSGVYFYSVNAGGERSTRKVVIQR